MEILCFNHQKSGIHQWKTLIGPGSTIKALVQVGSKTHQCDHVPAVRGGCDLPKYGLLSRFLKHLIPWVQRMPQLGFFRCTPNETLHPAARIHGVVGSCWHGQHDPKKGPSCRRSDPAESNTCQNNVYGQIMISMYIYMYIYTYIYIYTYMR